MVKGELGDILEELKDGKAPGFDIDRKIFAVTGLTNMLGTRSTSIATLISVACHLAIMLVPATFFLKPQPPNRETRVVLKFGKEPVPKAGPKREVTTLKSKLTPKQLVKKPKPAVKEEQMVETVIKPATRPEEEIVLEEVASIEPSAEEVQIHEVCEGPNGDNGIGSVETGASSDLYLHFLDLVKRRIEAAKRYPLWASKRGFEGTALVQFEILCEGHCQDVKVVGSSGFKILDKAAMETINRASPFPSPSMIDRETVEIDLAIVFNLK